MHSFGYFTANASLIGEYSIPANETLIGLRVVGEHRRGIICGLAAITIPDSTKEGKK